MATERLLRSSGENLFLQEISHVNFTENDPLIPHRHEQERSDNCLMLILNCKAFVRKQEKGIIVFFDNKWALIDTYLLEGR